MLNINELNQQFSKDFSKILNQKFIITDKNKCFFISDDQRNVIHFSYLKDGELYSENRLLVCTKINEDYIEWYDLVKEDFRRFKISNILKIENHLKELEPFMKFEKYLHELEKMIFENDMSYFCDLETLEETQEDDEEINFPKEAVDNLLSFLGMTNSSDFKIVKVEEEDLGALNFSIKIEKESQKEHKENVEENNPTLVLLSSEKEKEIATQLIKKHDINGYVIIEDDLQGKHEKFLTLKELINLVIQKYTNA